MDGGIVKTFAEKRAEAVLLFPLVLKPTPGETEALAGEVGTTDPLWNKKAAELDNELEAVGAVPCSEFLGLEFAFVALMVSRKSARQCRRA